MSEANMSTGAARRIESDRQVAAGLEPTAPGYEPAFLLALQPALHDLARYGIKLAVNAGNTDTEGLYKAVTKMVQAKKLDLKVSAHRQDFVPASRACIDVM